MRTSMIAIAAVLGLAGWQIQGMTGMDASHPIRTAYQDTVQRYQGGQSLQRSAAPQRTQPMANGGDAAGVEAANAGRMS